MYTIQDMSANENPSPATMLDSIAALIPLRDNQHAADNLLPDVTAVTGA